MTDRRTAIGADGSSLLRDISAQDQTLSFDPEEIAAPYQRRETYDLNLRTITPEHNALVNFLIRVTKQEKQSLKICVDQLVVYNYQHAYPDILLPKYLLNLEADGGVHNTPSRAMRDQKREEKVLEPLGIKTVRIPSYVILAEDKTFLSNYLADLLREPASAKDRANFRSKLSQHKRDLKERLPDLFAVCNKPIQSSLKVEGGIKPRRANGGYEIDIRPKRSTL